MGFLTSLFGGGFEGHLKEAERAASDANWEDARLAAKKAVAAAGTTAPASSVRRAQDLVLRSSFELSRKREAEADELHAAGEASMAAEKMLLAAELATDPREAERLRARADKVHQYSAVRAIRDEERNEESSSFGSGSAVDPREVSNRTEDTGDETSASTTGAADLLEDRGDPETLFADFAETVSASGLTFRCGTVADDSAARWNDAATNGKASATELCDLALAFRLYGMDASAAACLEQALAKEPHDGEARLQLIGLLLAALPKPEGASGESSLRLVELGRLDSAQDLLVAAQAHLRALQQDGTLGATGVGFESLVSLWMGADPATLVDPLTTAWHAEPGNAEVGEALIEVHQALGQEESAVAVLRELSHAHPEDAAILFRWGELEERRGNAMAAKELFRQASALGPKGGLSGVLRDRLNFPVE